MSKVRFCIQRTGAKLLLQLRKGIGKPSWINGGSLCHIASCPSDPSYHVWSLSSVLEHQSLSGTGCRALDLSNLSIPLSTVHFALSQNDFLSHAHALQPCSSAWMPFLQTCWTKPFAVVLDSCHIEERRKGPLWLSEIWSVWIVVTRIFLSFAIRAKRCIFGRQKFLWVHPAERISTITWQNLLN